MTTATLEKPAEAAAQPCVTIEKRDLRRILALAGSVVGQQAHIPILSCVLLEASGSIITARGTNQELEILAKCGCPVSTPFTVAVNSRLLSEVVNSLEDGPVTLTLEGNKLRVNSGAARFHLDCMSGEDFPLPSGQKGDTEFSLAIPDLLAAIRSVRCAVSDDDGRPALKGALWEASDGVLTLAATDTTRLAVRTESKPLSPVSCIVPGACLDALSKCFADINQGVTVSVWSSGIRFETADITITSKLVEGPFPAYRRVIPDSFEHCLTVSKSEFLTALKRVLIIARMGKSGGINLSTQGSVLSLRSQEAGQTAREEIPCSGEIDNRYSAAFLIDAVSAVAGDTVCLRSNTGLTPLQITGADNDDYRHILMPMNREG